MHQKTQNHFFKFSIHLSVRRSRENQRQIYGKSKASLWMNLSSGTPPPNVLGQSFALQLQFTIDLFFRTTFLGKLFDIRFSYKHCNFSRVCLQSAQRQISVRLAETVTIFPWPGCFKSMLAYVIHPQNTKNPSCVGARCALWWYH